MKVKNDIEAYIPYGRENAISRKRLAQATGLSDREIRETIALARRNTVILNLSDGNGYFRPIPGEEDNLVKQYYKQELIRLKRIGWSLRATRMMLKEIENGG